MKASNLLHWKDQYAPNSWKMWSRYFFLVLLEIKKKLTIFFCLQAPWDAEFVGQLLDKHRRQDLYDVILVSCSFFLGRFFFLGGGKEEVNQDTRSFFFWQRLQTICQWKCFCTWHVPRSQVWSKVYFVNCLFFCCWCNKKSFCFLKRKATGGSQGHLKRESKRRTRTEKDGTWRKGRGQSRKSMTNHFVQKKHTDNCGFYAGSQKDKTKN